MSLSAERLKTNRSAFIFLGAILLAVMLWPVMERVADKLTAGLESPAASSAPAQPKR
jgi:hypothetical protein